MIRLFVALELPEEHRQSLSRIQGGLSKVRWVTPQNLHITLRFVGEVNERVAQDLDDELALVDSDAFEIRLAGIGHFDSRGMARAVWAGVEASPPLTALQARIESAAIRAGLPPEKRKFHPHVTLARLKGYPLDRLAAYMADSGGFTAPPFAVSHFTLMSSRMTKDGSVYTTEARYNLRQVVPDAEFLAELA